MHTVLLLPVVLLAVFCHLAAGEIVALPLVDRWTRDGASGGEEQRR
jgi:hypothetical protein